MKEKIELPDKRLLKLSGTYWLETYNCYLRLTVVETGLIEYFRLEAYDLDIAEINRDIRKEAKLPKSNESENIVQDKKDKDKIPSAQKIFDGSSDISNHVYMQFLIDVLNNFNSFNATYQSKKLMIHKLWSSIVKLLKKFAVNCIKTESIDQITDPNFDVKGPL